MSRITIYATLTVAVLSIGAGYVYVQQYESKAEKSESNSSTPASSQEDLKRRKIEGIGSVRDLKPVDIPTGPAR